MNNETTPTETNPHDKIFNNYFETLPQQISAVLENFQLPSTTFMDVEFDNFDDPEFATFYITIARGEGDNPVFKAKMCLDDKEIATKVVEDLIKCVIVDIANHELNKFPPINNSESDLEFPDTSQTIKLFDD